MRRLGLWLALVGSGWAHGVILGLSWAHLEAKKATERRQKGDRNTIYNSVTFLSLFVAFSGPGWALVGLWLGLWLALVGSGWAHGVILELSWGHLLGLALALAGLMGSSWGNLGAIWKQTKRQKGDRKLTEI